MRSRLQSATIAMLTGIALVGCGIGSGRKLTTPPMSASAPDVAANTSEQLATANVPAGDIKVFVPCGIAGPYGEIAKLWESRYPQARLVEEVANIEVQTKLILDGKATPDLWISLGDREVQLVKAAGLVDGEPVTYAYNSLAFMVAKDNPCGIDAVESVASDKVKTIAMPTEENSSGYYMVQAFKKAGVWEKVQPKLWLTPQPAMVKGQLAAGRADVGVVYYPCTRETRIVGGKPEEIKGKVQLLGKIPAELSGPIPAQAAVVRGAINPTGGRALAQFLLTDEAQDIWEKWAFDRVKPPASGPRTVLYMYCGAGIRPFMDRAVEQYTAQHRNIRIDVGYAGSGCLLSQLTFAKRGDLYMPGEDFYLNQAKQRGYITSEKLFGYFEPVLLVQKGNPKGIQTVQDLVKPGLKVGVGEPEAAAVGRAAELILKNAGILQQVEPNIIFRAGNVPELGNAVKLKSLDVAIVWRLTAVQVQDACDAVPIPADLYKASPIPIGILKFSQHPAEALAFVDFCVGPEGQKIAEECGITPVAKGAAAG